MRVFAERQVIPTIYAVGMALERNPQAAETMARQGCDVVDQGWRWLDYHGTASTKQPSENISASPSRPFGD